MQSISAILLLILPINIHCWRCPVLNARPAAECSCDMPMTLRCAGDHNALQIIGRHLREQSSPTSQVTLLDCALRGVGILTQASLQDLQDSGLHGLVISSGEIRRVQQHTFIHLPSLSAIGLPNNQLPSIPTEALTNLPKLNRLDLSYNKIISIDDTSFKGLSNLTDIDLSNNLISTISPESFKPLFKLLKIRLAGNKLEVATLQHLRPATNLRTLDLSSNQLKGTLNQNTIPIFKYLNTLNLDDNIFSSIRRNTLAGLSNLTYLSLHNNQIDVLEDHSFRNISKLTHLDLSHNEIVAVSGSSLAHLTNLQTLDLSHNFLRSLSAEPLTQLTALSNLFLHDNDISMVDDEALTIHLNLTRLTIEDNPLNCDCLMSGFARWLRDAKSLNSGDRSAAVCATPPHLEGAMLSRLSRNKLCDDSDGVILLDHQQKLSRIQIDNTKDYNIEGNSTSGAENANFVDADAVYDYNEPQDVVVASRASATLTKAWYSLTAIHLAWLITDSLPQATYTCQGITIQPVRITSEVVGDGKELRYSCRGSTNDVAVTASKLDETRTYRICVAMEETPIGLETPALLLSCSVIKGSDVIPIHPHAIIPTQKPTESAPLIRVSEVRSNLTSDGSLTVFVSLLGLRQTSNLPDFKYIIQKCYVIITVHSNSNLVAQRDTPCRDVLSVKMDGFIRGPYEVCSYILGHDSYSICITPQYIETISILTSNVRVLNLGLSILSVFLVVLILVLVWVSKKFVKKVPVDEHRCVTQNVTAEEASYVILKATTKV